MYSIRFDLTNCYGIKKLATEFDFTDMNGYVVYASNGSMKTSFAKTFAGIVSGEGPKEEIFNRIPEYIVKKSTGDDIQRDEILVIEPYNANFESSKISSLMVNKSLQDKYNSIHRSIEEQKQSLLSKLKQLSGVKDDIEDEFTRTFGKSKKDILELFSELRNTVLDDKYRLSYDLTTIKYSVLFNQRVLDFLREGNTPDLIMEYTEKLNELLEQSTYFVKGVFTHNNAADVGSNLAKNKFFKAKHALLLNGKELITTQKDYEELIQEEKAKILTNEDLLERFERINSKLEKNREMRDFRQIIENHPQIIPDLADVETLKKKLWIAMLQKELDSYKTLVNQYDIGKIQIEAIIEQAKKERTEWQEIIEIFRERFVAPFEITVTNQEDVILRDQAPGFKFTYKDGNDEKEIDGENLLRVLSTGEKRAYYLLNIIYEIQARKKENRPVLIIADDIADSFDYRNKYAIVEYLKEIIEDGMFNVILLTHNFDFYRTVGNRILDRAHCLMAVKSEEQVKLVTGGFLRNVFSHWKTQVAHNKTILIASIPFVRNIVEYLEGENCPDYKKLTSLLHIKSDTMTITTSDLEEIFKRV